MIDPPLPIMFANTLNRHRLDLIASSYRDVTGHDLVQQTPDVARALWTAPAAIVAHDTQDDPVFFFGNRMALDLFETNVEQFTAMPSRLSAERLHQDERARLLDRVSRNGFIDDYAGIRISTSGTRFRIEQAVVWNLIDPQGKVHGQAATFSRWTRLPD